jgi:Flavin-binding monooxygenase-like
MGCLACPHHLTGGAGRASYRGPMAGTTAIAQPWAVVGAGPHGLAVVKAMRQLGVAAVGYERAGDVGGMWNSAGPGSRVFDGLHTVTTKPFTQYPDFPMPADYPDYPSHRQILLYLRRYARHFEVDESIRFGCEVESVAAVGDDLDLTVRDVVSGETTTIRHAGLVVATGIAGALRLPRFPGQEYLDRPVLHASQISSAEVFRGKRVLVVGSGSSGAELAVEAALAADEAYHSTRSGYRCVPKYLFGTPTDQLDDLLQLVRLPASLRRAVLGAASRILVGRPAQAHRTGPYKPVINQLLPYYIRHGQVIPKPDIEQFIDGAAVFTDNTTAHIDLVVMATGYEPVFPFVPQRLLDLTDGRLALNTFSPTHPGVVVAGLIKPDAGQWTLAHWQAMLIAHYARLRRDRPVAARDYIAGLQWQGADDLQVAHQQYLRDLQRELRELECAR